MILTIFNNIFYSKILIIGVVFLIQLETFFSWGSMTKKKKITDNTHHCENCEGKEDYDNSEVMGALEPFFEIVQNEYNRERDRTAKAGSGRH